MLDTHLMSCHNDNRQPFISDPASGPDYFLRGIRMDGPVRLQSKNGRR